MNIKPLVVAKIARVQDDAAYAARKAREFSAAREKTYLALAYQAAASRYAFVARKHLFAMIGEG